MMSDAAATGPGALLGHADFVRDLARSLLFDPADADDAAQETWLATLSRPPGPLKSPRAWLATVVRRRVVDALRGRSRRAAREAVAARPEAVRSTAEVVATEELRRRVVDAVLALDEPYRSTVLFRFYDDLQPAAIAARQGAPVETVRTRLKRGVAQLRARLDGACGPRAAWCALLLPLVGLSPKEALAATGAGGLLMGAKAKLVAAVAVLGIGVVAWQAPRWLGAGAGGATDVGREPLDVAPNSDRGERAANGSQATGSAAGPATPAPAPLLPGSETGAVAGGPTDPPAITGRVVKPDGTPLPGARVFALRPAGGPRAAQVVVECDAHGRYAIPRFDRPWGSPVWAEHPDWAPSETVRVPTPKPAVPVEAPELRMRVPAELAGVVLDQHGRSLSGAEVSATGPRSGGGNPFFSDSPTWSGAAPPPYRHEPAPPVARTDAHGRWRLPRLAPTRWFLQATAEGHGPAISLAFDLAARERRDGIELRLPDGAEIRGRVEDPAGNPVASAEVTVFVDAGQVQYRRIDLTDASGRFRLAALPLGPHTVSVSAVGHRSVDTRHDSGREEVIVVLARLPDLRVRVADEGGAVLDVARFAYTRQRPDADAWIPDSTSPLLPDNFERLADGRYLLHIGRALSAGYLRGVRVWAILADGRRERSQVLDLRVPNPILDVELVMLEGRAIRGVVHRGDGTPAGGVGVRYGPAASSADADAQADSETGGAWPRAVTDDHGRFSLRLSGPGPVVIRAGGSGPGTWESEPLDVVGPPIQLDVVLDAQRRAGLIAGTLHDGAGRPCAGAMLALHPKGTHDGSVNWLLVDADGRFATQVPYAPGDYWVQALIGRLPLGGLPIVHVPPGGTSTLELRLPADARLAAAHGTVLRQGAPWPGAVVVLSATGENSGYVRTHARADGTFVLPAVPAGPYVLGVLRSEYGDALHLQSLVLPPEGAEAIVDCAPASIAGAVELGPLAGSEGLRLRPRRTTEDATASGLNTVREVAIEPDGRFQAKDLAPGTYDLLVLAPGVQMPAGRLELARGEQRSSLRLRVDERPSVVRGRVIDGAGRPVAQAQLTVTDGNEPLRLLPGSRTRTDADGRFELHLLWHGMVIIDVDAGERGSAGEIAEATVGGTVDVDVLVGD